MQASLDATGRRPSSRAGACMLRTDERPAMTAGQRMRAALHRFASTLVPTDMPTIALYVGLSLAAALAGSVVAVCLLPLVQPGHSVQLAGYRLALPGGLAMQAGVFIAVSLLFAARCAGRAHGWPRS